MTLEKQQKIEAALKEIWNNPKYNDIEKGEHYVYPIIKTDVDILFIGINPSYKKEHDGVRFYEITENLMGSIPYFKAFDDFAKKTDASWTHIDLLFFRETEQNKIHDILKSEIGRQYVYNQLMVADKLIRYANPKVIVVCNALARVFMGKEKNKENNTGVWMDYDFIFDEHIGTYRWEGKPVFFSSMLSGQRALDKGSLERLQWQVKRALSNRK